MTWPAPSTIVMIVLLNDAFTCAVALPTFLRSFAFFFSDEPPPAPVWDWVLISLPQDLLVGDGLARALARTRIAARALAAHGETATVTQTAIAIDLLQSVDVLQRQA